MSTKLKEVTAWQCACGKAYLMKNSALSCCSQELIFHCACGGRIKETQWRCEECQKREKGLKWETAESRAATCDELLYSDKADKYIQYDIEEFLEGLNIEEEEYQELLELPHIEISRQYRIYICKPKIPPSLNLNEQFEDYCFEDHELPGDWEAAEKAIDDWISSAPADKWPQHPTKIAWNGVCLNRLEWGSNEGTKNEN
jgi:hypothetical protein